MSIDRVGVDGAVHALDALDAAGDALAAIIRSRTPDVRVTRARLGPAAS